MNEGTQTRLFDQPTAPKRVVVRDPVMAAAIGICATDELCPVPKPRSYKIGHRTFWEPAKDWSFAQQAHPIPCRYCSTDLTRKLEILVEFNHWAGFTDDHRDTLEPEVETFMALPAEDRRAAVWRALGYKEGPDGSPTGEWPARKRGRVRGTDAPTDHPSGGQTGAGQGAPAPIPPAHG